MAAAVLSTATTVVVEGSRTVKPSTSCSIALEATPSSWSTLTTATFFFSGSAMKTMHKKSRIANPAQKMKGALYPWYSYRYPPTMGPNMNPTAFAVIVAPITTPKLSGGYTSASNPNPIVLLLFWSLARAKEV